MATYNPATEEEAIKQFWAKNNIYEFNPHTKKKIFSIDTPPPTMSGAMHIGHAVSFSQQDIIARFKRLTDYEVFYPFGTDDNGIPTEKLVQKSKNVLSSKMQRDDFIKLCIDFLSQERPAFIQDWINIGMSCDFTHCYSTIDPQCRRIAQESFIELYKAGRAYRKEAPVIWDTMFQTAIAQAELVDVEKKSYFNDIEFTLEDGQPLIIATTRPELLPACVAIFAHPDDERYKPLFGKRATTPLFGITVPIMADEKVSMEKGTGIVMCCTFGDQTDIEWYKKYNLTLKMAITADGKMSSIAQQFAGMKIEDARTAIIEELKATGKLKNQKEITHTVNVGERSGKPVEILNSTQWYISYLDKREEMFSAAKELDWKPAYMRHRLENWIRGLNWDWSISRQRHYGVPIPVWYDKQGNVYLPQQSQLPVDPVKDRPLGVDPKIELIPERDVFDTWFTSASTPIIATERFKNTPIFDKLFPMDLRPQAHDIINFWLFYTMTKTRLLYGKNPWRHTAISGYILDPKGEKMSKSKGNTVAPRAVMQKYSADAIRYWAASIKLGEDTAFQEKEFIAATKLVNKLVNAANFVFLAMPQGEPESFTINDCELIDQWMLEKVNAIITKVQNSYDELDFAKARFELDEFFWHDFCDDYLELVKDRLYKPEVYGERAKKSGLYTLYQTLKSIIVMYSPILCFVTEKIYQTYYVTRTANIAQSIHVLSWPQTMDISPTNAQIAVDLVSSIRRFKGEAGVSLKTGITSITIACNDAVRTILEKCAQDICGTIKAQQLQFGAVAQPNIELGDVKVRIELEPTVQKA